jgi:ankyrin repeat protein
VTEKRRDRVSGRSRRENPPPLRATAWIDTWCHESYSVGKEAMTAGKRQGPFRRSKPGVVGRKMAGQSAENLCVNYFNKYRGVSMGKNTKSFTDNDGNTPLLLASLSGQKDLVKALIDEGADINEKNKYGQTPLIYASRGSHIEIIKLLLSQGADVNKKYNQSSTPLTEAMAKGNKEIIELLMEKGADVNLEDQSGNTPLILAVIFQHKEIVELLISKGADVNAKNKNKETPLNLALSRGYKEIAEMLKNKGAVKTADKTFSEQMGETWDYLNKNFNK